VDKGPRQTEIRPEIARLEVANREVDDERPGPHEVRQEPCGKVDQWQGTRRNHGTILGRRRAAGNSVGNREANRFKVLRTNDPRPPVSPFAATKPRKTGLSRRGFRDLGSLRNLATRERTSNRCRESNRSPDFERSSQPRGAPGREGPGLSHRDGNLVKTG
jgi:hypothetical protein